MKRAKVVNKKNIRGIYEKLMYLWKDGAGECDLSNMEVKTTWSSGGDESDTV